jgi:UDP-glucose 4-epimerase
VRALVTGGAGFIGSHVVDALVERGDDVWVLDNLASGSPRTSTRTPVLVEADVRDAALSQRVREAKPETCFHLAAQADVASRSRARRSTPR